MSHGRGAGARGICVSCSLLTACPHSPLAPTRSFITAFVTVFATVIAITKDLPDVEGDKANNITTFATRLGVRNVAMLGGSRVTGRTPL